LGKRARARRAGLRGWAGAQAQHGERARQRAGGWASACSGGARFECGAAGLRAQMAWWAARGEAGHGGAEVLWAAWLREAFFLLFFFIFYFFSFLFFTINELHSDWIQALFGTAYFQLLHKFKQKFCQTASFCSSLSVQLLLRIH
jgi:hypothetical protein